MLFDAYMEYMRGRASEDGLRHLWNMMGPKLGHFHAEDLVHGVIQDYMDQRRHERLQTAGKPLADASLYSELSWLRAILGYAKKQRLITEKPYIARPPKPAPRDRHLSDDEMARLLKAAKERSPHVYIAIVLLYSTGARVTALLELTWDRVDFETMQIDLRGPRVRRRKGRAVVPMSKSTADILRKWRPQCQTDYVIEFRGQNLKSIRTGFKSAAEAAGVPDATPHVLRHTAAVKMARGGASMARIAQFLGHANSMITEMVYARFSPDHLRKEADMLDVDKFEQD